MIEGSQDLQCYISILLLSKLEYIVFKHKLQGKFFSLSGGD